MSLTLKKDKLIVEVAQLVYDGKRYMGQVRLITLKNGKLGWVPTPSLSMQCCSERMPIHELAYDNPEDLVADLDVMYQAKKRRST